MKRRRRKRSSKRAGPSPIPPIPPTSLNGENAAEKPAAHAAPAGADVQTPPDDEFIHQVDVKQPDSDPASPSGAECVIDLGDELLAAVEAQQPAGDSFSPAQANHHTPPGNQFSPAVEQIKPVASSLTPAGADRRSHPRYKFLAAGEVVAAESGARMETRVRDLSQQGCYVDTSDALPLGTVTQVRITKGVQLFYAPARVVYSRAGHGMGLMFTAIEPEQVRTLDTWLSESRETSWLAANRRRSQRVLMTIPVRVSGHNSLGSPFNEETHTRAISAHGALMVVSTRVGRGQRLTLSNLQTKAALECVVAHIAKAQNSAPEVGVEFMLPNPIFWHVAFPPKDWTPRHPHAKSRVSPDESS